MVSSRRRRRRRRFRCRRRSQSIGLDELCFLASFHLVFFSYYKYNIVEHLYIAFFLPFFQ